MASSVVLDGLFRSFAALVLFVLGRDTCEAKNIIEAVKDDNVRSRFL